MPALSLAAAPGRRLATIELAREIERRGFSGIYCASFGDGLGLCLSIAHATKTIRIGTGIAIIYTRNPMDMAQTAAYIHEVSGGRFSLGLGVSHIPALARFGVQAGKPVADMRAYVEKIRSVQQAGELPPIVLATLRKRMVALAAEIAQGAMWANAARSHLAESLKAVPADRLAGDFFVGNMLNVCVDDDRAAAAAVMKRSLTGYLFMPNYRNYWREAGYGEEMDAVEAALGRGDRDALPGLMSDKWLADTTLSGSVDDVRRGLEEWYAAGMKTPILVPASTKGGQMKAFEEVLAAFS